MLLDQLISYKKATFTARHKFSTKPRITTGVEYHNGKQTRGHFPLNIDHAYMRIVIASLTEISENLAIMRLEETSLPSLAPGNPILSPPETLCLSNEM